MTARTQDAHSVGLLAGLVGPAALAATLWWTAAVAPYHWGDHVTSAAATCFALALGALLVARFVVHVPVHEVGHLVVAMALRMPVLGVRVGPFSTGLQRRSPQSHGHVLVDLARVLRWRPLRMSLMLLAGPAANLVVAGVVAAIAADPGRSTDVRAVAVGVALAGAHVGIGNLLPRVTSGGTSNDGWKLVRWVTRPAVEQARVQLAIDVARLGVSTPRISSASTDRLDRLRAATHDPRPELALAALVELIKGRRRHDDGWTDADAVARIAARPDVAGDVRAVVSGNYALALALGHVGRMPPGESVDPGSTEVRRIAELAELARAANRDSLVARTALGMARVLQDRPAEARAVLVDVPSMEQAGHRARAFAVRAMAESALGATADAARLAATARQLAPEETAVRVLDAMLAARVADGD